MSLGRRSSGTPPTDWSRYFCHARIGEALEAILTELEGELRDSAIADTDKEKLAAQRSIALIDAAKWKHQHTDIYIPASWVRQILERFASGEVSLLEDEVTEAKSKKRSSRQRRRVDRGR